MNKGSEEVEVLWWRFGGDADIDGRQSGRESKEDAVLGSLASTGGNGERLGGLVEVMGVV